MFIVVNKNYARLCKDNKFRSFAHFGTFPSCVKFYKQLGWAKRIAKRFGGHVVSFKTDGDKVYTMNASGDVAVYIENGSRMSHHIPLENLIVGDVPLYKGD